MRSRSVAQDRRDILIAAKENGKVDVSAKYHGVGNGDEMWSVLVGQAENGAEIRDATSS